MRYNYPNCVIGLIVNNYRSLSELSILHALIWINRRQFHSYGLINIKSISTDEFLLTLSQMWLFEPLEQQSQGIQGRPCERPQ